LWADAISNFKRRFYHGAKFVHIEILHVFAHPLGRVKHGTSRIQLDKQGYNGQNGKQGNDANKGE